MLALAALFLLPLGEVQGQTPRTTLKPVILGRFTPGGPLTVSRLLEPELVIAVWADGRAIWRDPYPIILKSGDTYSYAPGKFYQSSVDPAKLQALLDQLHADKAFELKGWSPPILDVTGVRIRIASGHEELHLMWLPLVRTGRPGDPDLIDRWERGTRALDQVAGFIAEVKRAPAREIPRPHQDEFAPRAVEPDDTLPESLG